MKKAGVMINLNFQLSENGDHLGDRHACWELSMQGQLRWEAPPAMGSSNPLGWGSWIT